MRTKPARARRRACVCAAVSFRFGFEVGCDRRVEWVPLADIRGTARTRKPRSDRERNPMPDGRRDNGLRLRAYVIAQSARRSRVSTTARGRECPHHVGLHLTRLGAYRMQPDTDGELERL